MWACINNGSAKFKIHKITFKICLKAFPNKPDGGLMGLKI